VKLNVTHSDKIQSKDTSNRLPYHLITSLGSVILSLILHKCSVLSILKWIVT